MYMDGINLFVKKEEEREILIHAVIKWSQDIEMEFEIKNAMLAMENGKRHLTDSWN